ncbi:TerB family tellurite resistance protein [Sulfurospirillum barnesii]|uniref:Co-chaperone DjlA N-terminal domain-containing protein n=1 Tax=Sulfurospirillum barnesii (strain ATCC 700032 / DSM 10660 / SES-3) TaxID=760154 RepID=I3Y0A5_SULBS|nr:TerB family tellurite resistance protein [Sulfurospirillum barnesii]AFL69629.1 hypothetical protein Sulba_2361 [Sulfurospirillum barnesii SES-3]
MYLHLLKEEEQEDFLELAYHLMGIDGMHQDEEVIVFESYKHECSLEEYIISKQNDLESVIANLKNTSSKTKRIILIELFEILLTDGEVHENEKTFINHLASEFKVSSEELEKINKWTLAMDHIVKLGYTIINKGNDNA